MAKETRQRKGDRSPRKNVKPTAAKPPAKARAAVKPAAAKPKPSARPAPKPAPKAIAANARPTPRVPAKPPSKPDPKTARAAAKPAARPEPPQPTPPAPRKPGYYEALAMYENGVRALQRHDYQGAAVQFRAIMERYPEERELQERSHLYLRVCERETARQPPTPQTPQERVYAATVALNAGDTAAALDHLRRALNDR